MSKSLAVAVAEKAHADLGASTAHRWMPCPGSIRMIAQVPKQASSYFADEGTAAHALAELCLRNGVEPQVYVDTELEKFTVDEDMAEAVKMYTDYCRGLMETHVETFIERKFNLAQLKPPGPMFGTGDFAAYDKVSHLLEVVDLKFGRGVLVDVKDNPQLLYYALGVVLALGPGYDIDEIKITVVQPRAAHTDGPIRSHTVSYEDLLAFSIDLLERARLTTLPDAPLVPGEHCRFCPAAGGACPAEARNALTLAQSEFSDATEQLASPPDAETLPEETFLKILAHADIIEAFLKGVRGRALARLERGEAVPGVKLVAKRATRKWRDDEYTKQWLKALPGELSDEEILVMKLKSPAQIEKVIGAKNLPTDQIVKESSGYTMVSDTDSRPAIVLTPGEEFTASPSGDAATA